MFNLSEPSQTTGFNDWQFIDDLKSRLHRKPHWNRYNPKPEELYLGKGVKIIKTFPDPGGLLDTAWQDLEGFMDDVGIPVIEIIEIKTTEFDTLKSENIKPGTSKIIKPEIVKSSGNESEIVAIQAIKEEQG
ncbi:MAG: hypothetical protein GYA02_06560, partial [Clostridiaceae bacterium]|nr:hypothetical protein [Clostridiaceae bacterium]